MAERSLKARCKASLVQPRNRARERSRLRFHSQPPRRARPAPRMQLIGVNIVPPRDLADHCVGRLAFLDDPQLLSRRPPPAPLKRKGL